MTPSVSEMIEVVCSPPALAAREPRSRDFATSFCNSLRNSLSRYGDVTPRQHEVIVKLWKEVVSPQVDAEIPDLSSIRDLFSRASSRGLKRPAIHVTVDDCALELSRAPDHGKNPGCIYVHLEGGYAGKIFPDNRFRAREDQEKLTSLLVKFGSDPAGVAAASGHLTGRCSFCNRKLTDERSTAVGYGSTCADNYGLPWGV